MTKATWSPRARAELRSLISYLRRRNSAVAVRASKEILAAGDQLLRFPDMGRPATLGRRERSLSDWHIVMVYRVMDGAVEISTLRDTRRKPIDQVED